MGRTLWNVGHVEEAEGEVLVAGDVPRHASIRDDLGKLPDAFHDPTQRGNDLGG